MKWWQKVIASRELRAEFEELKDRHAREVAELDQWKSWVLGYIEENKRIAMREQINALEEIHTELDYIERLPDCSEARKEFLHFMRIAVETRLAVLHGELEESEWREVLERSFQVRSA
jgi:hypothetical protein